MGKANDIQKETIQIGTVQDLTSVFETTASTQVAKVKDKVAISTEFFHLLWQRYSSLRLDPNQRITERDKVDNPRQAFVIISAEGGLSGDIDKRLIERMLEDYEAKTTDVVVLGTHGAQQLNQSGVPYTHYFKVPETDEYIDVSPVVKAVSGYDKVVVYYEEYISLGVQDIKTINLMSRLRDMSEDADEDEDIMTSADTIFEPSLEEIADDMEQIMMNLALSQTILESGLAQAASRFNAMAGAKERATELLALLNLDFHRAKRSESDRRMREIMTALKKKRQRARANT